MTKSRKVKTKGNAKTKKSDEKKEEMMIVKQTEQEKKKKKNNERIVTMAALEEMSDSDGELPPEEEWDSDAKALKKFIDQGKFDELVHSFNKKREQNEEDDEEESIEEIILGDDDDDVKGDNQDRKKNKKAAEMEDGGSEGEDDDDDDDDDEDDDDDDDDEKEDKLKDEQHKVEGEDDDDEEDDDDDDEDDEEGEEESRDNAKKEKESKPRMKSDSSSLSVENDDDDDDEERVNGQDEGDGGDDHRDQLTASMTDNSVEKKNEVNSKALHIVTQEMSNPRRSWPWPETFTLISSKALPFSTTLDAEDRVDIHDDLKREVTFYDCALEAALEARQKCKKSNVPFSRPEDFFAEMVKTDQHMAKIKDRLIFENKKMDAVAQRKSNKEQKLRAREAHANKLAEKAKRKKDHFKAVDDWAQSAASQRGRSLADDDSKFMDSFGKNKSGPSKKRQAFDKKYGYGGKRGRFKQTDPKTLNDVSGFNPRGNFGGLGSKRSRSGSGSGANRAGKRARDAKRARR